jgi:signal transduction histidine kinase
VHTLCAVGAQALDLEKIDTGKFEVERVPVPLARVLADAVDQLAVRARASRVRLALDIAALLRPDGLPVWAAVDRHRLAQAVLNLGTNAVKFTPHDGSGRVVICAALHAATPRAEEAATPMDAPTSHRDGADAAPLRRDDGSGEDDVPDVDAVTLRVDSTVPISIAPTGPAVSPVPPRPEVPPTSRPGIRAPQIHPVPLLPIVHVADPHPACVCTISVSDNGVGMSAANVAKLFQPFVQVRQAAGPACPGQSGWRHRSLLLACCPDRRQ